MSAAHDDDTDLMSYAVRRHRKGCNEILACCVAGTDFDHEGIDMALAFCILLSGALIENRKKILHSDTVA